MPIRFNLCEFLNPVFIETGIGRGDGIKHALNAGFPKIYSIEIVSSIAATFQARMARYHGRVEIIEGNSSTQLPTLLAQPELLDKRITFWLDAHPYGTDPAAHVACPLYAEITAIGDHPLKNHTILIDDRRLLSHYGVDENAVKQQLTAINSRYCFSYLRGFRQNDVLAAYVV